MALNVFDRLLNAIPEQEQVESDIAFRVAQRIDFLMRKYNMSKSDLARQLHKDPAQISRWMSGTHNFSIKTLAELEILFNEPILVSPTATAEVAEYTHYIESQNANKRANQDYEEFKGNQEKKLFPKSYPAQYLETFINESNYVNVFTVNLLPNAHTNLDDSAGNYQYAMSA